MIAFSTSPKMQSAALLHLCSISHKCHFVDAAHKRIMLMKYDAVLRHWKFLHIFLGLFSCLVANTGKWPDKWGYGWTTSKSSCFGTKVALLGYEELIKMRSAPRSFWFLRRSTRCNIIYRLGSRSYIRFWDLFFKSLFLQIAVMNFIPIKTLLLNVTSYSFIFATKSNMCVLYIQIIVYKCVCMCFILKRAEVS